MKTIYDKVANIQANKKEHETPEEKKFRKKLLKKMSRHSQKKQ